MPPLAIDYDAIFVRLQQKLAAYIVDDTGNPILAEDRIISPAFDVLPPYPHLVIYLPLTEDEDDIGMNPPSVHKVRWELQTGTIAWGSVSSVELQGNLAGRLLIDYGVDFFNLPISSDPKEVRPGDEAVNTTTGESAVVVGVLEPEMVLVDAPIFLRAGDGYEIRRTDAYVRRLSGRRLRCRFSALDTYEMDRPGSDPVWNVNAIASQIHDYMVMRFDDDFADLCVKVDLNGLGSIVPNDFEWERSGGQVQRIFRRDVDVTFKATKVLEAIGDQATRVTTTFQDPERDAVEERSDTQEYSWVWWL